ncbi:MAG: hypothetical protein IJS02_01570, partial [Bacteroidales bacterium]|nr:hypothetical protein [Bacteroidales bacterium]
MTGRVYKVLAASAGFILAFFSFVSCIETDYSIGAHYAPTDQNLYVKTSVIDVPVGQKLADSLQSMCYQLAFGSLCDSVFGATTIDLAATVTPQDTGFRIPNINSVEVRKAYIYGYLNEVKTYEENQDKIFQHFSVYQLDRVLDSMTIFSNSIEPKDYSVKVNRGSTIYDGCDTLMIYLQPDFAKQFLVATDAEFDSLQLYIQNHKGIYIKADKPDGDRLGGRFNYFSNMTMYVEYSFADTERNIRRDTSALFDVGSSSHGFAIQTYDHSAKDRELAVDNDSKTLYYQGLSGVKPYISAASLKTLLDEWAAGIGVDPKKIMIARASLVLPYEDPENLKEVDYYPQGLFPCTRAANSKGIKQYSPLVTIYDDSFNKGGINTSLNCYRPDITMLVQDLLLSKPEDVDEELDMWLIAPFEYVQQSQSNSSSYLDYMLYDPYSAYGYGGYGYGYTGASMYNSSYYSQLMSALYASQ